MKVIKMFNQFKIEQFKTKIKIKKIKLILKKAKKLGVFGSSRLNILMWGASLTDPTFYVHSSPSWLEPLTFGNIVILYRCVEVPSKLPECLMWSENIWQNGLIEQQVRFQWCPIKERFFFVGDDREWCHSFHDKIMNFNKWEM